MTTPTRTAADTAFDRAIVDAHAAFDRARAAARRALAAPGGRDSAYATAIVAAYAAFDRDRAAAHANYARDRA
jgi:hypothetical protein